MREKRIDAWHFVSEDKNLAHCGLGVEAGYIYSEDGPVEICSSGLHASRRVYDALGFAPGPILCKVRLWGDVTEHSEKLVARHREVIAVRDVSAELRLWGCWCIRNTPISGGRTVWDLLTDERSRTAVETAEKFARGEATSEQLSAAGSAAWSAARSAARSAAESAAESAAGSAARSAAWSAARSAARSAAESAAESAAWSAAESAAEKFQANELERRMVELFK